MSKAITTDMLKAIRPEMDAALAAVGKKFGVVFKTGHASYNPAAATFKVSLVANNPELAAAGVPQTKEAADFKQNAVLYGLRPDHLGKTVRLNGETFTIVGVAIKSHKFPILCRNSAGKVFKFQSEVVCKAVQTGVPAR